MNKISVWHVGVITVIISIIFFCNIISSFSTNDNVFAFTWIGNFLFIYGLYVFNKKTGTNINQYSLFWISWFLFSFGQCFLYSIGFQYKKFDLFSIYGADIIECYLLFFIFSSLMILTAGELIIVPKNKILNIKKYPQQFSDKSVKRVFWVLLFLSGSVLIPEIIEKSVVSQAYGYAQIYEDTNDTNTLVSSLSMLYIPSIFILITAYKSSKVRFFMLALLLIPVLGYLYVGTRSAPIGIILCFLYLWHIAIKPIRGKYLFIGILCIPLLFQLTSTIALIRSESDRSFVSMADSLMMNDSLIDPIVNTLGEMGGSMQVWLRLQYLIPGQYDYGYGFSYLAAVLACIPSFLLGGFSFTTYANLSSWITNVEGENYGLGFSTLGEAYYNFGWFGIIFMFFVSCFIFYMLTGDFCSKRMIRYKPALSAIVLYIFVTTGRNAMYLSIRYIVYSIMIPIIIISLIDHRKRISKK